MTRTECLSILELSVNASRDDVVIAYRHLVQVWHPDRFPNNPELQKKANAKLAKINDAYSLLINEFRSNASENQNPNVDPNMTYRDEQVMYLGYDPRLKPLPRSITITQSDGIPAIVEVSSTAVTLATLYKNQNDEVTSYARETLVAVELETNRWIKSGRQVLWMNSPDNTMNFYFDDPEEILSQPIRISLKFRNSYFAQVFLKRIHPATTLSKWESNADPKSETSSTDSQKGENRMFSTKWNGLTDSEVTTIGIILILIFVYVLSMVATT